MMANMKYEDVHEDKPMTTATPPTRTSTTETCASLNIEVDVDTDTRYVHVDDHNLMYHVVVDDNDPVLANIVELATLDLDDSFQLSEQVDDYGIGSTPSQELPDKFTATTPEQHEAEYGKGREGVMDKCRHAVVAEE